MKNENLRKAVRRHTRRMARGALVDAVLVGLAVVGVSTLLVAPGLGQVFKLLPPHRRDPAIVIATITRLSRQGLLIITGDKGARHAFLTKVGLERARFARLALPPVSKSTWDGTWFAVSYDIPHDKRSARDALTRSLKKLGFLMYQRSLYLYPHGAEDAVELLRHHFSVSQYVTYFTAADIADEKWVRRHFFRSS